MKERKLKKPILVKRTDTIVFTITTWVCAYCNKREDVPGDLVDSNIPPGWVWMPYHSARFPTRDMKALGCCANHAALAATLARDDSVHAVEAGYTPRD